MNPLVNADVDAMRAMATPSMVTQTRNPLHSCLVVSAKTIEGKCTQSKCRLALNSIAIGYASVADAEWSGGI
jgi:hypothetical protein